MNDLINDMYKTILHVKENKNPLVGTFADNKSIFVKYGIYLKNMQEPVIDLVETKLATYEDSISDFFNVLIDFCKISNSILVVRNVDEHNIKIFLEKNNFIKSDDVIFPTYRKKFN